MASQTAGQSGEREEKTITAIPSVLLNTVPLVPQVTEKIFVVLLFVFSFRWPLSLLPLLLDFSLRTKVYHRARRGGKRTKPITKLKSNISPS